MGVRLTPELWQHAIGFTPADLEANRDGRLSEVQLATLRAEIPRSRRQFVVAAIVTTLFLLFALVSLVVLHDGGLAGLAAMLAFVAGLVAFAGWLGANEKCHLGGGEVRHKSGILDVGYWVNKKASPELRIEIHHFHLTPKQYEGLCFAAANVAGTTSPPLRKNDAGNDVLDLEGHWRIYFLLVDGGSRGHVLSVEHRD